MHGIESDRGVGLGESQRVLLSELKRLGGGTLGELGVGLARETVRDHLRSLEAAGLVERAGLRREGRGRPRIVYRLSARGEELFPQREGELLRELTEFLDSDGRREILERFFAERNRAKHKRLVERLGALEGVGRLAALAAALTEDGFLAEASESEDGSRHLRLCHCPWRRMVEVSRLPCRAELSLASELLGCRLERESYMPDGDATCTYLVAPPRRRSPAPKGSGAAAH